MEDCVDADVTCDRNVLQARLLKRNTNKWWVEASEKSKLRTFINIHDSNLTQLEHDNEVQMRSPVPDARNWEI